MGTPDVVPEVRGFGYILLFCLLMGWFLSNCVFSEAAAAEPEPWTMADTQDAVADMPYPIACIVYYETWPHWDPYSVGAAGELGPAQLHPQGLLPLFLHGEWTPSPAPGFRDPFDPYVSAAFLLWWGETHGWTFFPWTSWRLCS